MNELIVYPEEAVGEDGTIAVTPEVIAQLLEKTQDSEAHHTEGAIRLRVNYEDLKVLIGAAGHSVREIRWGVEL